jgi:hypothetical protein
MAQHPGLFVHQQQILVLVHHVHLGHGDLQKGVALAGFFEELVVDVHLYRVPDGQLIISFCAFAVDFYPLEAYIFLCERRREQRNGLAHKAVQPLARVVLPDRKFLQNDPLRNGRIKILSIVTISHEKTFDNRYLMHYNIKAIMRGVQCV